MPQPSQNDVHVDAILTNLSMAYIQQERDFIAGQFCPAVPVDKQSDRYYVYDKSDFMNDDAVTKRADGQESTGGGFKLSTDTYFADVWATHKDLGPQMLANYDNPLQPNREATLLVTRKMLIRRERLWRDTYFSTAAFTHNWTGTTSAPATNQFRRWSDFANSDPRADISAAKMLVKSKTGFTPNTMVLAEPTYEKLRLHPDLEEVFKGSDNAQVSRQRLASLFEIERLLVAGAVSRTSPEFGPGLGTDTYDFMVGKHALLAYIAPNPGLMIPSAAYRFDWRGLLGMNAYAGRVSVINTPLLGIGSYRVEGEFAFDMKVTGNDLGIFFKNAIS